MGNKIVTAWEQMSRTGRLYACGTVVFATGFLNVLWTSRILDNWYYTTAFYLASLCLALGFVIWIYPIQQKIWQRTAGKLSLALFHAVILLLAIIPSRFVVANALGLPPQDFDITVSIFALALYPLLWMLLVSIAAFIFACITLLSVVVCSWSTYPLFDGILVWLAGLLPQSSPIRQFVQHDRGKFIWAAFCHAVGALTVCLAAAHIHDMGMKTLIKHPQVVRWVAYAADYHEAVLYPNVAKGVKMRLHENGVVSYAVRDGRHISLTVGKFPE